MLIASMMPSKLAIVCLVAATLFSAGLADSEFSAARNCPTASTAPCTVNPSCNHSCNLTRLRYGLLPSCCLSVHRRCSRDLR